MLLDRSTELIRLVHARDKYAMGATPLYNVLVYIKGSDD